MRIAAIVLAAAAGLGCKDKQAAKQAPAPAKQPTATSKAPPSTDRPALETPDVVGPGLVPAVGLGPKVTFTKTEIQIDGESVVTLGPDGLVDPARLQTLTRRLEGKATSDAPVAISLDATLPYARIGKLLDTFRRAGFRNLALLAGSDGQMIPIELPDATEANSGGLRPVVSLDGTRLMLWSASGEEGTKRKPKLVLDVGASPSFAPLTRALAEIVQKRWPDGKRPPADRTIIVQLDGRQSAQVLLNLLAAVRADGSLELFPNIFLAGGL